MNIGWKDITSYSRGYEQRTPSIWENRVHGLRIVVHRHVLYASDQWLLSCHQLGIDKWQLENKEIDKAAEEAIQMVLGKLESRIKEYKYIIELLS